MGQVASAFPTAGGLYHWASILGGRGWGWVTAWFNLGGLVTVLAAVNVGAFQFAAAALGPRLGFDPAHQTPAATLAAQIVAVTAITVSQAAVNHRGIRLTTRLTDFSGWFILFVAIPLAASMLFFAKHLSFHNLVAFSNYSGPQGGDVWPATGSMPWLFVLGFLLPAYTITGFDASAHTAEETVGASVNVPRGVVRSVLVSGVAGWVMLSAVVCAVPDLDAAAAQGDRVFAWIVASVLPGSVAFALSAGVAVAMYLCGLATVTSASRMAYAFARDGGLPISAALRRVSPEHRTPALAIWTVAILSIAFTVYAPVYTTIAAVCTIFLYLSYVIPTALGFFAWGRTWTTTGPWGLGRAYRPLALVSVLFCGLLVVVGVQPPNDKALWIVAGAAVALAVGWFGWERRRFAGPPAGLGGRENAIAEAEARVGGG